MDFSALYKQETVKRFLELPISREEELQDIVTLAAEICQVPIAMITLMDEDTQWIRFKVGTDYTQNTRENSFCKYLIDQNDVMMVPDTHADTRFINHPLVANEPNVRFYAGAPLNTHDGQHLGTLCIFDQKPHELTAKQQNMLSILAKQVVHLMELEMSVQLLKDKIEQIEEQHKQIETSELKLRSFLESTRYSHVLIDSNLIILDYNSSFANIVQRIYNEELQPGTGVLNYISEAFKPVFIENFNTAIAGFIKTIEYYVSYNNTGGTWLELTFTPAYHHDGEIYGIAVTVHNINERKRHIEAITSQNKALTRIAYIQSHELRKPVASIIGLMDIIKLDRSEAESCLDLMEKAVEELDDKIRSIVNQTQVFPALDLDIVTVN